MWNRNTFPGGREEMEKKDGKLKNGRGEWYKLDLSAIVYPTLQRRDFSSVYRLSVVLKEEIKPDVLQKALDLPLPQQIVHFPGCSPFFLSPLPV